jgi:hypothetical protein
MWPCCPALTAKNTSAGEQRGPIRASICQAASVPQIRLESPGTTGYSLGAAYRGTPDSEIVVRRAFFW